MHVALEDGFDDAERNVRPDGVKRSAKFLHRSALEICSGQARHKSCHLPLEVGNYVPINLLQFLLVEPSVVRLVVQVTNRPMSFSKLVTLKSLKIHRRTEYSSQPNARATKNKISLGRCKSAYLGDDANRTSFLKTSGRSIEAIMPMTPDTE